VLVLEKGFDNLQDEVRFFKEVKPKILSMKFAIRALMEYDLEKNIQQDKDLAELQLIYLNKMQFGPSHGNWVQTFKKSLYFF
jgi:hypothetical protein